MRDGHQHMRLNPSPHYFTSLHITPHYTTCILALPDGGCAPPCVWVGTCDNVTMTSSKASTAVMWNYVHGDMAHTTNTFV